ncbi:MAG: DHCW motif cupin fold protein [Saprospiraceae bacterium]|nr:DHCW motif cupin fold protein [Saprospiraceae bacterium]
MNIHLPDPLAIHWGDCPMTIHPGEQGEVAVKQVEAGDIRIRTARYSPGYLADHWCVKGHIVQVLEGQLIVEHQGSETMVLEAGMTYLVGDDRQPHRVRTEIGASLFIID